MNIELINAIFFWGLMINALLFITLIIFNINVVLDMTENDWMKLIQQLIPITMTFFIPWIIGSYIIKETDLSLGFITKCYWFIVFFFYIQLIFSILLIANKGKKRQLGEEK